MSLGDLFRQAGNKVAQDSADAPIMNIIEFIESEDGLAFSKELGGQGLFPVQRFILKMYYNIPLDDVDRYIKIPKSWEVVGSPNPEDWHEFTEVEYLRHLYEQGRCNVKVQDLSRTRRELVLPIGRRSGKSLIAGIIATYETYKLLKKYDPQAYYGMPPGAAIQICSVATATEQAKILYNEVKRHFDNCKFFQQYIQSFTQKWVKFQTPADQERSRHSHTEEDHTSMQVTFFSSNSSGLRGSANMVVILDEFAFFPSKGVTSDDAVYQAVTPSTATFSQKDPNDAQVAIGDVESKIVMISSPYAKHGVFYSKYAISKSGTAGSKDVLMIQAPTWEVNITVPQSLFQAEYEKDPSKFWTEYGAEFSDSIKAWIEKVEYLEPCIDYSLRPSMRGRPREIHYLGLDIGLVNDRAVAVLTRPDNENIRLVYHEQWQAGVSWEELNPHLDDPIVSYAKHLHEQDEIDFEELVNWIYQLSKRFYIRKGLFDQWSGKVFEQAFNKMGLSQIESRQFTGVQTSSMYQEFKTRMMAEQLLLYDFPCRENQPGNEREHSLHIEELLDLEAHAKSKKQIIVEAPPILGKHDDFADALMRSVHLSVEDLGRGLFVSSRNRGDSQYNPHNAEQTIRAANADAYHRRKQKKHNYVHRRRAPRSKKGR